MTIDPKQSWMGLAEDISYICKHVGDPHQFSKSILEVLDCLKQNTAKEPATILDNGESYQMKNILTIQKQSPISVSVVEYYQNRL